jgi:hypothetical protein
LVANPLIKDDDGNILELLAGSEAGRSMYLLSFSKTISKALFHALKTLLQQKSQQPSLPSFLPLNAFWQSFAPQSNHVVVYASLLVSAVWTKLYIV